MEKSRLQRIVFGLRFIRLNQKEKIKYLIKSSYFSLVTHIITGTIIIFLVCMMLFTFYYPIDTKMNVVYKGLNESQIEHAKSILSHVKPNYLKTQRQIIFTDNITKQYIEDKLFFVSRTKAISEAADLLGYNQRNYIVVEFSDNDLTTRSILCHELLHSFMRLSEQSHRIVYDVNNYLPCFSDTETEIHIFGEAK